MEDDRTQPVYILDDHRTIEWLNRTQALSRAPAMRGGAAVDHGTRRQTVTAVAFVLLLLLILILLPWPTGKSEVIAGPVEAVVPGLTQVARKPSPPPATPPIVARPTGRTTAVSVSPSDRDLLQAAALRSDRIAPHAPVWMDGVLQDVHGIRPRGAAPAVTPTVRYEPNVVDR